MTENFDWIAQIIRDLEDFCRSNGLEKSAQEFSNLRPKIEGDIHKRRQKKFAYACAEAIKTNA